MVIRLAAVLALFASGSIHTSASLPHSAYGIRDAPLLSVSVSYSGPDMARNLSATVSVTNAFVQGQRGTVCTPRGRRITCRLLPVANGASAPLNVLLTDLTPGTLRIQVSAVSDYYTGPTMRSATSLNIRVLPCVRLVRAAGGAHCR
jgi:hypothetical protein